MELAAASPRDPILPAPCPKVFVYSDLTAAIDDDTSWNQTQSSYGPCSRRASSLAFGQRLRWHNRTITHFRSTSQLALGRMVRHRLLCSQRCRALSPRSADLFFAPVLTAPKTHGQYVLACNRTPAAMVQSELRYFSHDRACRHFFIVSKGHYVARGCEGAFSSSAALGAHSLRCCVLHRLVGKS